MCAPQELIDLLRGSKVPVFIKTDNYVPAHISPRSCEYEGCTIGDDWDVERMRHYLKGEAQLNEDRGSLRGGHVMIFIGDAKYHAWVRCYRVTLTLGYYHWERIN